MFVVALLATAAAAAPPKRIATHDATGATIHMQIVDGELRLTSLAPATLIVDYDFDVNANGRVDPEVDVSFGVDKGGRVCAQKWLTEGSYSFCGQGRIKASAGVFAQAGKVSQTLSVALKDVSPDRRKVALRLSMYDTVKKSRARANIVIDAQSGDIGKWVFGEKVELPGRTAQPARGAGVATQLSRLTDAQLSDRGAAVPAYNGTECRFRFLPELKIVNLRMGGSYAQFEVPSQEDDRLLNNELQVRFERGRSISGELTVTDRRNFVSSKLTSGNIIAGQRAISVELSHPFDRIGPPMTYQPYVSVKYFEPALIAALKSADVTTLRMKNKQGGVFVRTFRTANLRNVERALQLTDWKCR